MTGEYDVNMTEDKEINAALAWKEIQVMLTTSKHYTARDRNEILAQSEWFSNVDRLDKLQGPWANKMAAAARKQLTLYYMVGAYGWDIALRTLKATKSEAIGIPAPVQAQSMSYVQPFSRVCQKFSYNFKFE